MTTTTIKYERKDCPRCGGCGEYSYNQMHGSRCYGCNGKGTVLSANGKRALNAVRAFMDENYSVPVEDLGQYVGRQFWDRDCYSTIDGFEFEGGSVSTLNGVVQRKSHAVRTPKVCIHMDAGTTVRLRPTPEQFLNEVVPFARRFRKGATIEEV